MVAPPNPFRCPPGPYERASMMAHVLKSKGVEAKIIIIDPKEKFSKQGLFQEGWESHYPGMVEWYGPDIHGGIKGVDVDAGAVMTDFDTFSGALLNVIPAQKAGQIAIDAGLADDSGFCPIDAASMRSAMDENVFVIGDASIAGAMPKSGFSANSKAKIAAMNVRAGLVSSKVFPPNTPTPAGASSPRMTASRSAPSMLRRRARSPRHRPSSANRERTRPPARRPTRNRWAGMRA